MTTLENACCEYCECENEGTIFDEDLKAWICEKHVDMVYDSSGYCSRDCQLGYGCDDSC